MKKTYSGRFKIDLELIKRWARSTFIMLIPAIIIILTQIQETGQFNATVLVSAGCASVIDFLRRFSTDYSVTK